MAKGKGSAIFYLPKPVLIFSCSALLILATLGNLVAQEAPAPVTAGNAEPLPDNGTTPANSPVSANSQTTDNSQTSDNSQTPADNSQLPNGTQTPANSQVLNAPLLPQQGSDSNPYSPLPSSALNPQTSQLTTPALYTTGAYDLSQIANNAALMAAFGAQAASGATSEEGMGYTHGPIERIRLGPFNLKVALTMSVISDDNLLAGQGGAAKISDTSLGISPAVLLEYGAHEGQKGYASIVYAPTLTRYFHFSGENSDNQNIAFNAKYPFQKLSLDLSQTYTQVTGINQDLNARTTQTSSVSTVGGNYDVNDKLSVASHFQEVVTSYSGGGGEGDTVSAVNSSMSYHLSEKMTLGPSLNVGLERPQNSVKQTFEQALMGVNYQVTEKISLVGQGGVEFRQYDQGGDSKNPIFSAGVAYAPFDSTRLSLNGYQNVQPSTADSQQTSVNTGIGVSVTQRIMQRFYFGFSFDYSHTEYQTSTGSAVQTGGNAAAFGNTQDNLIYRPSLTYAPTEWTSIAIYYQYRDNESNTPGAGYHDNQMGVSVSAQF